MLVKSFNIASCGVWSCKNTMRNCNKSWMDRSVTFHRLPKDKDMQQTWVVLCQLENRNELNLSNTKICSEHFSNDNFLFQGMRRTLVKSAVPSLDLPEKTEVQELRHTVKELECRIKKLEHENLLLRQSCKKSEEALSKILTPLQIRMLKNSQTRTHWTSVEMAKAIYMKMVSAKAYDILRNDWSIPLPGISTIKSWAAQIDFKPGVLTAVLGMMKETFADAKFRDRQCVMAYDEMSVDNYLCYDANHDVIIGPHKKLLVVAIRGIFSSWKQPVFYDFDVKLTGEMFKNLILAVQDAGLNVIGMVSDLATTNRGLWLELGGITEEKSFFENPSTGEKVWMFADFPHLLKLLRNNVFDHGFKLSNGESVTLTDYEELVRDTNPELTACRKIGQGHIDVMGRKRMDVRMAFQTFSGTVANCFDYFLKKPHVAEFVHLVNNASDILNSRVPNHSNPYKTAFGMHYKNQQELLTKFGNEIRSMRAYDKKLKDGIKKSKMPFQNGILITLASLEGLFNQLKNYSSMKNKYILTSRLNQDFVENIFRSVRGLGIFNQNPSPLECTYRLKTLVFTKCMRSPKTCSVLAEKTWTQDGNTLQCDILDYLRGNLLGQNQQSQEILWAKEAVEAKIIRNIHDMEYDEEVITDENWLELNANISVKEHCELGGIDYIAGFMVSKLRKFHPELELSADHRSRNPPSWTQYIFRGHLATPSYTLLNFFKKLNEHFIQFHKTDEKWHVNRNYGVMNLLKTGLKEKFPEVDEKIINLFVKTRTHIRVNYINGLIKQKRSQAVYMQRVVGSNIC